MIAIAAQRSPRPAEAALTSARIPFIPGGANAAGALSRYAAQLGMSPVPGMANAFIAPDNSWVFLDANGRLQRGVREKTADVAFTALPAAVLNNLPVTTFQALGQPGAALAGLSAQGGNPPAWRANLAQAGFVPDPANPSYFTHPNEPNGSWALVIQDAIAGHSLVVGYGTQRVDPATLPGPSSAAAAQAASPAAAAPPPSKIVLSNAQAVRPPSQVQYGSVTAARLPMINPDPASLLNAVQQLGVPYTQVGQDQYQFSDGSWVMFNPAGPRGASIERGYEGPGGQLYHFHGRPPDLLQLPMAAQKSIPDRVAAAQVPSKAMTAKSFANALTQGLQFTQDPTGLPYYTHQDGSWGALVDGQCVLGHGSTRVDANSFFTIPPPQPGGAQIPLSPAPAQLPTGMTWEQWKARGYRAAWLPWASSGTFSLAEITQVLVHLGFQETPPGSATWVHGDSTTLRVNPDGSIDPASIRFCQAPFGSFPYTSSHSGILGTEAQRWKAWLQGNGLAPTDDPNYRRTYGI